MFFNLSLRWRPLDIGILRPSDLLKMRAGAFVVSACFAVCLSAGAQTQPLTPPNAPTPATGQPVRPGAPAAQAVPAPDPDAPAAPDRNAQSSNTDIRANTEDQNGDPNGQPSGGDYTGPSILSRGFNFARPSVPAQLRFRPFVGLNALYDSGLTAPVLGAGGSVVSSSTYGLDGLFGISGRRYLRKQVFELDYRGHVYYYGGNSKYNGQDHSLAMAYTRYLSSRLLVSLHENAGLYSNTYSVLSAASVPDISTGGVSLVVNPNTESFDSRTYYSSSEIDAVYQKTARLSFDIGSSFFLVNRNATNLANAKGYQARSDAAYRLTRRTTVGVYYAYTSYDFSHVYGNSNVNTVGVDYSVAFSKTLSLKLRVGGSRLEVQGLRTVTLDPVIASILGQSSGVERYYLVNYIPDISGTLSRSLRHSSYSVSFAEGVSPGNGLYLTSRHESESAAYNYTGIRNYAFDVSGGRDQLLSVGDIVGNYSSYYVRAAASHPLFRHLQGIFAADYRRIGFSYSGYGRNEFRLSLGFSFAPGEGPLKFW